MATSLEELEKLGRIEKTHANIFHLVKKNHENRFSRSSDSLAYCKKEEINASKIYSPVGNLAERAKQGALLLQRDFATRLSVQILPTHDGGIYRA